MNIVGKKDLIGSLIVHEKQFTSIPIGRPHRSPKDDQLVILLNEKGNLILKTRYSTSFPTDTDTERVTIHGYQCRTNFTLKGGGKCYHIKSSVGITYFKFDYIEGNLYVRRVDNRNHYNKDKIIEYKPVMFMSLMQVQVIKELTKKKRKEVHESKIRN